MKFIPTKVDTIKLFGCGEKWVNYHYTKKIFKHKLVKKGGIGVN